MWIDLCKSVMGIFCRDGDEFMFLYSSLVSCYNIKPGNNSHKAWDMAIAHPPEHTHHKFFEKINNAPEHTAVDLKLHKEDTVMQDYLPPT